MAAVLASGGRVGVVRNAEEMLFLCSAMELETAVRLKANIVHMVWIDGTYDMVAAQEKLKSAGPRASTLAQSIT
jgi:acetolactate synthase-1/2/3 large subunit